MKLSFLPNINEKLCSMPYYRAEILTIFHSFGRSDNFINSFWNLLTFKSEFLRTPLCLGGPCSSGCSYYTLGLEGGWFFGPWAFIILKSLYRDLSNEGSKFFWVHWNLFFKLLKHRHFWINFRFWLVWA